MSAVGDARKRLAEQTTPARTPHWDPAVVQLIEQARAEGAAEVVARVEVVLTKWHDRANEDWAAHCEASDMGDLDAANVHGAAGEAWDMAREEVFTALRGAR